MAKNDLTESFAEISEVVKNYLNARLNLIKLSLLQKISRAGTYLLTYVSIIVSVFAITIFLMFAFSFWYGEETGDLSTGFLLSAGIFLLILFLVYIARRFIFTRYLIKIFSNILFSDDENE